MELFKRKISKKSSAASGQPNDQAVMSEMVLKAIHDGVVITDKSGVIKFINPAAATMLGANSPDKAVGLDYGLVIKLESKEGRTLSDAENPLIQAMQTGQALEKYEGDIIVGNSDKRIPVAVSVLPAENGGANRIITFRNITRELEEEGEQTEFISTASHEMRTPVATIDGYLSLALNPQTATIDERARGYLESAQAASQHLGKLFQDLLDVTKLDDGHIKPHFEPVEMVSMVEDITKDYLPRAQAGKIDFTFGSQKAVAFGESRRIEQVAYGYVDISFMREILDNLIDNAIKYTPEGGSVYVNVRGDGDRVLINVTDTGMGISSDDLVHIFQKFYRADNSDTRTIGGTGLGLYLVKQRAEAMGGRVWAESAFGEGSTFFVSLPRLTQEEYDKRMIAVNNQKMQEQLQAQNAAPAVAGAAGAPGAPAAPVAAPVAPTPTAPAVAAPTAPVAASAPHPAAQVPAAPSVPPAAAPQPAAPTPVSATPSAPTTPAVPASPATPPVSPQPQPSAPQPPTESPPVVTHTAPKQIDINLNGGRK